MIEGKRIQYYGTTSPDPWRWLAPLALFAVGFGLIALAHTRYLSGVPGDLGDARFNGIILEYFYRWLSGSGEALMSPGFFYPMPGALAFSDNHWGSAWIYSIYRAAGADRYVAYDLWYLTGYILNFAVMHVTLRRLGYSAIAGAVGAFLFAFGMPSIARVAHAQLVYSFPAPLALLFWERFRQHADPRLLGWVALAVAAQFYISIYLGYFLCLVLLAWATAQAWQERVSPVVWFAGTRHWCANNRREALVAAAMLILAAASIMFLMYPYIHYAKLYGFSRSPEDIAAMLPRIRSYFLADASSLWHGMGDRLAHGLQMRPEHQMFVGVGALLLALAALFLDRSRRVRTAGLCLLLLAVLTLSLKNQSFYMLFADLPGVNSIRAVSRIILMMLLPLAILAAAAVDAATRKGTGWRALVGLLCIAMVLECISVKGASYRIDEAEARAREVAARVPAELPKDAVLFVPQDGADPFYMIELDGMLLAQERGVRTLNGYSGNFPPGYANWDPAVPGCVQAKARLDAARGFYDGHIHRKPVRSQPGTLFVAGSDKCIDAAVAEIPLDKMGEVAIRVDSAVRMEESVWRIRATVENRSGYDLLGLPSEHPFRLSWRIRTKDAVEADTGWVPRIELGTGVVVAAGQSRTVEFLVQGMEQQLGAQQVLEVSLVQDGRVWFHDHGLVPATVGLPGSAP